MNFFYFLLIFRLLASTDGTTFKATPAHTTQRNMDSVHPHLRPSPFSRASHDSNKTGNRERLSRTNAERQASFPRRRLYGKNEVLVGRPVLDSVRLTQCITTTATQNYSMQCRVALAAILPGTSLSQEKEFYTSIVRETRQESRKRSGFQNRSNVHGCVHCSSLLQKS